MSAQIINGRELAKKFREELRSELIELKERGIVPRLEVILVGEDEASKVYVRNKGRACEKLGIQFQLHHLPAETTQTQLQSLIKRLNEDPSVDGILLQLPLPNGLDAKSALRTIDPDKDVDGLHPENLGRLLVGEEGPKPCTPLGCMALIDSTGIEIRGKKAVVVGRSNLVGKPMSLLLLQRDATVEICHSKTPDLSRELRDADIVVVAVGKANFLRGEWIKPGAVVIDVGINRLPDGKLTGDVEFETAREIAGAITPVPGGVGPMTITMLLHNIVQLAKRRAQNLC